MVPKLISYDFEFGMWQAHTVLEMNYSEQQLSAAVTSQGLRPVLAGPESRTPLELSTLIEQCWHGDPARRPSFDYIVESLHEITAKLFLEKESEDTSVEKPDVCISSNTGKNGLEQVLNYTQQKRTDVNWASRAVERLRPTIMEQSPSSPGWLNQASEDTSYLPILSMGSFATKGARQTMEDTNFLKFQLGGVANVHAFGVFDGHRGMVFGVFFAFSGIQRTLMYGKYLLNVYDVRNQENNNVDLAYESICHVFLWMDQVLRQQNLQL